MEVNQNTGVPGLFLIQNFIENDEEEEELINNIQIGDWKSNRQQTRRVQVYGPYHDKHYRVYPHSQITPIPHYLKILSNKIIPLLKENFNHLNYPYELLGQDKFTEIFINEYLPWNQLQFHKDHCITYKEVIIGISLASTSVLSFKKNDKEIGVVLPRKSLYLMTGDSRYNWEHGMHPGSLDEAFRFSITYRLVNYS
eukprot:TRINITY_DN529_c0_g1_i1.p1 TRINITY_DN529_c0_g1~~TRINITY_DN529_c0_g1_i1.p1  ORF type:complete len:197 (+),score=77.05 TRINITY_DN529_c0_g1_i1:37-627(+)